MTNIIEFKGKKTKPEGEAALTEEESREKARDKDFDLGKSLHETIHLLREFCADSHSRFEINGTAVFIPHSLFIDDLEKKLLAGMVTLSFEDDPEVGKVAQIITFRDSIKPKKPKSTETIWAMPVRRELSPEEREERRIKREAMKAERHRQRAKQLAFLREQYGEDQAQAYAALMGWR